MKLRRLSIKNFGCIGDPGYEIDIDNIVILIGKNNVGKSTVFDAYMHLAESGPLLDINSFHNGDPSKPIEIGGTFSDLTPDDLETTRGDKWKFVDPTLGECIRYKWVWNTPGTKGEKHSWDPENDCWVKGGMGGWDSLIASRVPAPLRIRPIDDATKTEEQIADILISAAKIALKNDSGRAAQIYEELKKLNTELEQEVSVQITDTIAKISSRLSGVFPGYTVSFDAQVGKFEPEKAIGAGSQVHVLAPGCCSLPLSQQGAGLRRTFLWTAVGSLADAGRAKVGKNTITPERQRVLLIEEPEAFLHPPMIRAAREALYALAEIAEWQVIASTHSPVFIDVSKPHTTIVRVSRDSTTTGSVFSTDKASFDDDERTNLQMIRSCHPTVNEFFFADHAWLVEGDTEHAALKLLLSKYDPNGESNISVVNCMGKANLPTFAKILNQFGMPYTIIHDSDSPKAKRKDTWITNAMWTINTKIMESIEQRNAAHPPSFAVVHVPDFESYYFGAAVNSNKPYECLKILLEENFDTNPALQKIRDLVSHLRGNNHPQIWNTSTQLSDFVSTWVLANPPVDIEQWQE